MKDLESQVHRIIASAISAYNAKALPRREIERKATKRIQRLIESQITIKPVSRKEAVISEELEALLKPDIPYDNLWTIEDEIKCRIKYWRDEDGSI